MVPSVVRTLSSRQERMLLAPPAPGPDMCGVCLAPVPGRRVCHRCHRQPRAADTVLAVSYSPHDGALHAVLRDYKATGRSAGPLRLALSAILWRFLARHERCLAAATGAGAGRFDVICLVPSGRRKLAFRHPLVGVLGAVEPVADRFDRALIGRAHSGPGGRRFEAGRFRVARPLGGQSVLLVDDTWTTGASAQSAAAALKLAGAGPVGVLVIGRHVRAEYGSNRVWLSRLAPFDWERCARCGRAGAPAGARR